MSRSLVLVAGASQTGKTTFCCRYLANAPAALRFVFDQDGDFAQRFRVPAAADPAHLAHQINQGWAFYDPTAMFPGQAAAGLAYFLEWAWTCAALVPGRKIIVVDEINRFVDPWNCPGILAILAEAGRKRDVELILTAHRPNKVNGVIANQLTELVCFRMVDDAALDQVKGWGADPEAVRALPPGTFAAWNLLTGGFRSFQLF